MRALMACRRISAIGARMRPQGVRIASAAYGTTPDSMNVLASGVDTRSDDFARNASEMNRLVGELRDKLHVVRAGGGKKAVEKHTSRGKLFVRDRINALLDPGSPFLELSPLAGWQMYGEDNVAAGGVVTGIGRVQG